MKRNYTLHQAERHSKEMSALMSIIGKVQQGVATEEERKIAEKLSIASQVLMSMLGKHKRIGIVGPHASGKSLLASMVSCRRVFHGDDHMDQWSSQPLVDEIVNSGEQSYVVEGCSVARAIRKAHEQGHKLVDALIIIDASLKPQSEMKPGHIRQAAGITTVLKDCLNKGCLDGVTIIHV